MKTDIEYAALVAGVRLHHWSKTGQFISVDEDRDDDGPLFDPLEDDGDSRRLEIACLNCLYQSTPETVAAWQYLNKLRRSGKVDSAEYKAAVFALAVAIGKVIDGGGV